MKKAYKKSILGLDTVKAFIVVLLAIAIVAVVALVVLGALNSPALISSTGTPISTVSVNETINIPATDAVNFDVSTLGLVSLFCGTITEAYNGTIAIDAANYTQTGCSLVNATSEFIDDNWTIAYPYNYKSGDNVNSVVSNTSNGIIAFFANSTTYFALLGVVVIILIISLVVVVVNRFGGGGTGSQEPSL